MRKPHGSKSGRGVGTAMQIESGHSDERNAAAAAYKRLKAQQRKDWTYERHLTMARLARDFELS